MKAWIGTVALVGTLASSSAMALDGNGLLSTCQTAIRFADGEKNVSVGDIGMCSGILEGVEGTIFIMNDFVTPKMKTCYPTGGTTNIQKARIAVKYMQEHPDQLHLPAPALALISYMGAFPCKK